MVMFSSRPPFSDDREPMIDPFSGTRYAAADESLGFRYAPRPEFDRPQHNPTNPILAAVRAGNVTAQEVLDAFAPGFDQFAYPYSVSMIDHARRVLERLARLP